jgi:hypothetical protein
LFNNSAIRTKIYKTGELPQKYRNEHLSDKEGLTDLFQPVME